MHPTPVIVNISKEAHVTSDGYMKIWDSSSLEGDELIVKTDSANFKVDDRGYIVNRNSSSPVVHLSEPVLVVCLSTT